ncbi:hypothetical protein BU23DRAFT_231960 [Bimuria novae-zelandiae CBS 107.79]|uniref:Uncharacterized protein n=1 Tax=Bimuria novae-zelandiae CBS 107.79 TaxID=1447943 RepID=A0A6A5UY42_9PLEO|nr:hypothetical protein BU23DRAFT_231960 [Bimuria novae-zelandiae CBS 107.79]
MEGLVSGVSGIGVLVGAYLLRHSWALQIRSTGWYWKRYMGPLYTIYVHLLAIGLVHRALVRYLGLVFLGSLAGIQLNPHPIDLHEPLCVW